MKILEITVKDLQNFLHSSLYKSLKTIPITPERVLSLINNPRAQADDVILVVAITEANNLAGFAGMLPDIGYSAEGTFRFAWNSGWWVDPVYGKGIALKLFYKSIHAWKGQYMITDLTDYTRNIIKNTGLFYFTEPEKGVYLKIRSNLILKEKVKLWKIPEIIPILIDSLINSIMRLRLNRWQRKYNYAGISVQYISQFEPTDIDFIHKLNKDELCKREYVEFEWITSYQWLASAIKPEWQGRHYPFLWLCRQFKTEYIRLLLNDEIIGLAMLTNRDGNYKIPYAYFRNDSELLCYNTLCNILIEKQAYSFLTFREKMAEYFINSQFPVLRKRTVLKDLAVSKTLTHFHPELYILQDGDGDVVFT